MIFFLSAAFWVRQPWYVRGDNSFWDKAQMAFSGEETLGLHGYLLVNFGYVGMFTLFFVLGLFYNGPENCFKPTESKDAVGWLVYWWVILAFFVYFRDGVLILVIKQQLTWWVTIALLAHFRQSEARA